MQITTPAVPAAPIVSGHPFGLPGVPPRSPDPRRVEAATDSQTADNMPDRQPAAGSPSDKLEAALDDPGDHVAPPSIMQLRISALLAERSTPAPAPEPGIEARARSAYDNAPPAEGLGANADTDSAPEPEAAAPAPRPEPTADSPEPERR
ncbi:hypothetical protein [Roseivivax sediminis]|nr:hypothetical protein [Roseivivax sediminis]